MGNWLSENLLGNDQRYPGARTKAGNSVLEEAVNLLPLSNSGNNFLTGPYGLTKQPRKFYLEIRQGEDIIAVTGFPYDPEAITVSRPNPVTITHTYGGTVRETSSIRTHMVALRGRSGTAVRSGFNRDGYAIFRSGQTIFKEFDEFLKFYIEKSAETHGVKSLMTAEYPQSNRDTQKNLKQGYTTKHEYELILRCLDDDLHLKVEPLAFEYSRSASTNRHDYQYVLQLQAWAYAYDTKPFMPLMAAENIVNNAIGQLTGSLMIADNVIKNVDSHASKVKNIIRSVQSPLGAVDQLGRSFTSLKYTASSISKAYDDAKRSYFETKSAVKSTNEALQPETQNGIQVVHHHENNTIETPETNSEITNDLFNYYAALQINVENLIRIMRGSVSLREYNNFINPAIYVQTDPSGEFLSDEANLGKLAGILEDIEQTANAPEDTVPYRCQRNEDLKKISKKFFGTHDLWPVIAELNGMPDSRRKADGGILDAGDVIFIPFDGVLGMNTFSEKGDIYSVDISMPYDDLEIISQDVNDFELISGIDNLRQGVKNKLLTFKGEMPNYEQVGLPRLSFVNDVDYTAAQIREVLIKDPRIADVRNIVAEVENDIVRISVQVRTLSGEDFTVKV